MAIGRYWFTESNTLFRPYFGLGIGTSWTELKLDVGQFSSTESRWQFAFAPEIGTLIELNDQFAFNLGFRYSYGTKAGKRQNSCDTKFCHQRRYCSARC